MRSTLIRREAELRLHNTESRRKRVWRDLAAKVKAGTLTAAESRQAQAQFWRDRAAERKLVLEGR